MLKIFNNPRVLSRSWYAVHRSRNLKRGRSKSVKFFDHKLALFRDDAGAVSALYAYCPHMGADLGLGVVNQGNLVCPYHKWEFDGRGKCTRNTLKAHSYPVKEKYGYIWIFNGEKADFPFPELQWEETDHFVIPLPVSLIRCHPHVIGTNNPDFAHLETLHNLNVDGRPEQREDGRYKLVYKYQVTLQPKNWIEKLFSVYAGLVHKFHIIQNGDSNIIMHIESRNYQLRTIINLTPTPEGFALARMILFLPKGTGLARFLRLRLLNLPLLLASVAKVQFQDLAIYNNIRFTVPEGDPFVARHIQLVERMGAFHPANPERCLPSAVAPENLRLEDSHPGRAHSEQHP